MGLLECASGNSIWRGYDYYEQKKVQHVDAIADGVYRATVLGSEGVCYDVEMNVAHPRKSSCTCPHAAGRRVICKHLVATYFTVFPEEAARLYAEAIAYEAEAAQREKTIAEKVEKHVMKMKKPALQEALLALLFEGPEWQYERFVREYALDDDW